jgi:3'-5' exoribonuclease
MIKKLERIAVELEIPLISSHVLKLLNILTWSGSSKSHKHHYGKGGLLRHTTEVIDLCMFNNTKFEYKINEKDLFLAALYHDVGKLWDYDPINEDMTEWTSSLHKYKIHHISRSAIYFNQMAATTIEVGFNVDEITHAILAHHGHREWGSPVSPRTKLAWLLHLCDGISARMDDCEKFQQNL